MNLNYYSIIIYTENYFLPLFIEYAKFKKESKEETRFILAC